MRARAPLLACGGLALLVAGWAGLGRIGVLPGVTAGAAATYHGALMVSGFVGTLICLERAIVARRRWAMLAPFLSAAGAIGVIAGTPTAVAALAVAGAAALLAAMTFAGAQVSPSVGAATMAVGALAWVIGALLWAAGLEPYRSLPWWILFLVLTVTAERMELSRALRPSARALATYVGAAAITVVGTTATLADFTLGLRAAAAGILVLALWLALRDRPPAATRTLALPRYIATAIRVSYAWLAVGALLMLTHGGPPAGWRYDALIHAVLIGFVLTMIFAHGPIILPAIVGVSFSYHRLLYVPLTLLQASLALRIAGDVAERADWRDWGAVASGIAVLSFMATMAVAARRRRSPLPASPARR